MTSLIPDAGSVAPRRESPAMSHSITWPGTTVPQLQSAKLRLQRTTPTHWLRLPRDLLREARPAVQAVFALRVVVAATVAVGPVGLDRLRTLGLIGSWLALTQAVYVFNGLTDVAADRCNGSSRPIAAGLLAPRTAGLAVAALAAAGMLGCALADPLALIPAGLFLMLGWAYSAGPRLKAHPCGFALVIGLGAALAYMAGWTLHPVQPACLAAEATIATWVGVCCAAKDFSDIDGDRQDGRRTWPVVLGAHRAAFVVGVAALGTALAAMAFAVVAPTVLPAAVVLLVGSAWLATRLRSCVRLTADDCREIRRRPYRAFLATQYLANLSVLVTLILT